MSAPALATGTDPTLGDYGRALRRRAWALLLLTVLGALAGYGAAKVVSATYTASTTVQVSSTGVPDTSGTSSSARTTDSLNLDTEAQLVMSADVATRAQKLLGVTTPTYQLISNVAVTVPPNTSVLQIAYSADKPAAAQAGSRAFADAYLADRLATATAALGQDVKSIQGRLVALQATLKTVTASVATLPNASADRALAQAQQGVLVSQINDLNNRLAPLTTATVTPGHVITEPLLPTKASSPSRLLFLAGGILVGLILGLLAVALLEALDKRIRGRRGVERALAIPVLARVRLRRREGWPALLTATSEAGRAFGELRNSVAAAGIGGGSTVLIAAVDSEAIGGLAAAGLAAAFGRSDGRATLVSATEHSAALQLLGAERQSLAEVGDGLRTGTVGVVPGLDVVQVPLQDGLLARAERALTAARGFAKFVVLETPPVSSDPTAQALAPFAGSVVLVVRENATHGDTAVQALRRFEQVGATVLGVVLMPRKRWSSSGTGRSKPGAVRTASAPEHEAAVPS